MNWSVRAGRSKDVPRAAQELSGHMTPEAREAFLGKLDRYARKPDRELFLAEGPTGFLGFATIIAEAPLPEVLDETFRPFIEDYACATGLFVLPVQRNRGLGACLVRQWETWAWARGHGGIWLVTRSMGTWYQRRFGYAAGVKWSTGAEKTIMIKSFLSIEER